MTDSSSTTTIRVALDWTPNTIHSGLYLALSAGLYSRANLNVTLLPPDPSYSTTPVKRLAAGDVDLAVCPSESCIAYAEAGAAACRPQAIYAILAKDASAIAGRKDRVKRVADLAAEVVEGESGTKGEGPTYASYNARYEDAIVAAMVREDGGDGRALRIESGTGKFSLFDAVKQGRLGATWIFEPWEGVEAELEGVELSRFRVGDYHIPYGYSPVIVRNAGSAEGVNDEALARFVKATREGYELAIREPELVVKALENLCEPARSKEFLQKSQEQINQFYTDGHPAGYMDPAKWKTWLKWLRDQDLLVGPEEVKEEELFTNKYFA